MQRIQTKCLRYILLNTSFILFKNIGMIYNSMRVLLKNIK